MFLGIHNEIYITGKETINTNNQEGHPDSKIFSINMESPFSQR